MIIYPWPIVCIYKIISLFFVFFLQKSEFDWSPQLRGAILSSFFYGYISTQLIGGLLGTKLGGVKLIGIGVLCTAVLTILTPMAARYSVYLVIFLRIVEGVFEVCIIAITFIIDNCYSGFYFYRTRESFTPAYTPCGPDGLHPMNVPGWDRLLFLVVL